MFRLSKLADCGTVIMVRMAREPGRWISAAEIAADTRLAQPTVSKVLKLLAWQALVAAQRGRHGGYALARRPARISQAEIIDAVEGRFGLTECASDPGACRQGRSCAVRRPWLRVDRAVRGALEGLSLTQMLEPERGPTSTIVFRPRGRGA